MTKKTAIQKEISKAETIEQLQSIIVDLEPEEKNKLSLAIYMAMERIVGRKLGGDKNA